MTVALTPPGITGSLQPKPPLLVTALPASPSDMQEVYYLVDSTNGIVWHLRYRAASASTYKWEYIGGAPFYSEVDTLEGTTSTTYVALTTAGPTITVPNAGEYLVEIGAAIAVTNLNSLGNMSYAIGATAAVDADDVHVRTDTAQGNEYISVSRQRKKTITAASTALAARYKSTGTPGANFGQRYMSVLPFRII